MEGTVAESVDGLNCDAVKEHGQHGGVVECFAHGGEVGALGLGVDPAEEGVEGEDEYGGADAHDEAEVGVLGVVVGGLGDGGVSGPALLVFDDAHVVGVAGGEDDDGQVDHHDPVELELPVHLLLLLSGQ